jgi:hypothetical protein
MTKVIDYSFSVGSGTIQNNEAGTSYNLTGLSNSDWINQNTITSYYPKNYGQSLGASWNTINSGDSGSISFWVKTNGTPSDYFIANTISGDGSFFVASVSGKVEARTYNSSWRVATSTTSLSSTEWLHFVVTYTATTINIYCNGVLEATETSGGAINASNVCIFSSDGATINKLTNCLIREFSIYNTELNASEVLAIYEDEKPEDYRTAKGKKYIKTNYPITEGLTAGTTKQTGRISNLLYENTIIPQRERVGL